MCMESIDLTMRAFHVRAEAHTVLSRLIRRFMIICVEIWCYCATSIYESVGHSRCRCQCYCCCCRCVARLFALRVTVSMYILYMYKYILMCICVSIFLCFHLHSLSLSYNNLSFKSFFQTLHPSFLNSIHALFCFVLFLSSTLFLLLVFFFFYILFYFIL